MTNVVQLESDNRYFFVCACDEHGKPKMWSTQYPTLDAANAAFAAHHTHDWLLVWTHYTKDGSQSWQAGPVGELGAHYTICPISKGDVRRMEAQDKRQKEIIASIEKDEGADGLHRLWVRLLHRLAELSTHTVDELVEDVRHHGRLMTDAEILEYLKGNRP